MSESRLNLAEERVLLETLKKLRREMDGIKALQFMSGQSGLLFYRNESSLPYDVHFVYPTAPQGRANIRVGIEFKAKNQRWPYCEAGFTVKVVNARGEEIPVRDPSLFEDISWLDEPFAYRARANSGFTSEDNWPMDIYVKGWVISTDKGDVSVTAEAY